MTNQHPATPTSQEIDKFFMLPLSEEERLTAAFCAGADQKLEACIQLLDINGCPDKWIDMLRAARRPTIEPVSATEPPWEREGRCDADMTNQHPITPSSELIKMVSLEAQAAFPDDEGGGGETDKAREEYIAIYFSRWGSDQELRACVEKVRLMEGNSIAEELFEARRPNHATP
jgi:hypothetical protein